MPETDWYAGIAGEKIGPLPAAEMVARHLRGEIGDDTLVWREGMPDWAPFSQSDLAVPQGEMPPIDFLGGAGQDRVRCSVSGDYRPASEMLQYGDAWIAPEHKETFLQGLREGRQPVALSWGGYLYQDAGKLAGITWWLIVASTIAGFLITVATLIASMVIPDDFDPQTSPTWVAVNASFSCVYLMLFVVTVVWYCLWLYRVAANVAAFGAAWVRVSPGWAVGWNFVPVANLWMPYLAMADISRASLSPETGDSDPVPTAVKTWWTLWIISNVLSFISGFLAPLGYETSAYILMGVYVPVGIASAWSACRMVTAVTQAQQATASREPVPADRAP